MEAGAEVALGMEAAAAAAAVSVGCPREGGIGADWRRKGGEGVSALAAMVIAIAACTGLPLSRGWAPGMRENAPAAGVNMTEVEGAKRPRCCVSWRLLVVRSVA